MPNNSQWLVAKIASNASRSHKYQSSIMGNVPADAPKNHDRANLWQEFGNLTNSARGSKLLALSNQPCNASNNGLSSAPTIDHQLDMGQIPNST
jgi:hypothetical protein